MERQNHNGGSISTTSGGRFEIDNSALYTLNDFYIDTISSDNEIMVTYPRTDGSAVMLIIGANGEVETIQVPKAGTTFASLNTSALKKGFHLFMIQNKTERRILEYNKK